MKVDISELTPEAKLENEKLEDELEQEDERAAKRHEEENRQVEECPRCPNVGRRPSNRLRS